MELELIPLIFVSIGFLICLTVGIILAVERKLKGSYLIATVLCLIFIPILGVVLAAVLPNHD